MPPSEEINLRQRTAGITLTWTDTGTPFAGAARDDYQPMIEPATVHATEARLEMNSWVEAGRRAGSS